MDKKKWCPLAKDICKKDNCALYHTINNSCSFLNIAEALDYVGELIDELRDYYKDREDY